MTGGARGTVRQGGHQTVSCRSCVSKGQGLLSCCAAGALRSYTALRTQLHMRCMSLKLLCTIVSSHVLLLMADGTLQVEGPTCFSCSG
jgi:hypothetical protein